MPKAKAARPDVPVIMITAYADDNTKRKALEGGADAAIGHAAAVPINVTKSRRLIASSGAQD